MTNLKTGEPIHQLPHSHFFKWREGEISNLGGFETSLYQTWVKASFNNRQALLKAFPYRFNERDLTMD